MKGNPYSFRVMVVICLGALWGWSCGPGGARDIVLITVDTLRADRIGAYGHSAGAHLAALAAVDRDRLRTAGGDPDALKVEDYWYLDPVNTAVDKLGKM